MVTLETMKIDLEVPEELVDNMSHEINYENLKGKILIGFCGYARSGKDTLAKGLINMLNFKRISFADTLKEDLNEFFRISVQEDLANKGMIIPLSAIDFVNPINNELKEILRPYMIWFGERMKQLNGIHHWTNRAFSQINEEDRKLVLTDVRRLNELEIFRNNKEFQKVRNKNREEINLELLPIHQITNDDFECLLFHVSQIHNRDEDVLTKETILAGIENWMFADTIRIDSRIQDIAGYHDKHVYNHIRRLIEKFPDYFI
jgi:hypothetical protein